jgi:hypothetical protein
MAEDAVSRELFSAKFRANRQKWREISALHRTALEINADKDVLYLKNCALVTNRNRDRSGNADSLLRGFRRLDGAHPSLKCSIDWTPVIQPSLPELLVPNQIPELIEIYGFLRFLSDSC